MTLRIRSLSEIGGIVEPTQKRKAKKQTKRKWGTCTGCGDRFLKPHSAVDTCRICATIRAQQIVARSDYQNTLKMKEHALKFPKRGRWNAHTLVRLSTAKFEMAVNRILTGYDTYIRMGKGERVQPWSPSLPFAKPDDQEKEGCACST